MLEKPPPRHPCGHCKGTGYLELTGANAETLELLSGQEQEVNGATLARLAGCRETAMNNRLVVLERHGYAVGRLNGRERLWRAVEPH